MKEFFRADIYRILALALTEPTKKTLGDLGKILNDLQTGIPSSFAGKKISGDLLFFSKALLGSDFHGTSGEYQRLFVNQTDCPTSEGSYHLVERGPILGDITAFYSAFGLKFISGEGPPDTMKMELAFMSYMALKEAHAREKKLWEEALITQEAEKKFLHDHLGRWGEIFARRLAQTSPLAYYQTLARLLKTWIQTEKKFFRIQPTPLPTSLPAFLEKDFECKI